MILGRIGRVDLEFEDFEVGVPPGPGGVQKHAYRGIEDHNAHTRPKNISADPKSFLTPKQQNLTPRAPPERIPAILVDKRRD